MGRVAGVTSADTHARLLQAAAQVFADRGYAGTRVAEIAAAAGVSNGALYAHYPSKAGLLVGALQAHGRKRLSALVGGETHRSIADLLLLLARSLPRRRKDDAGLVVEALVAARRDEEVAGLVRAHLGERADWLERLVRAGQADGDLDADLPPAAVAHFCLLLALGSALVPSDLHDVDSDEWAALLSRLITTLRPQDAAGTPAPHRAADPLAPHRVADTLQPQGAATGGGS